MTSSQRSASRRAFRWAGHVLIASVSIAVLWIATDRTPSNKFEADKLVAESVDHVRRFHVAFPQYTVQAEHFGSRGPIKTLRYRARVEHRSQAAVVVEMFTWCSYSRWGGVYDASPSPEYAAWVLYPRSVPFEERWRHGRGWEDRVTFGQREFDELLQSDLDWRVVGIDI